jgi:hypothetical protein
MASRNHHAKERVPRWQGDGDFFTLICWSRGSHNMRCKAKCRCATLHFRCPPTRARTIEVRLVASTRVIASPSYNLNEGDNRAGRGISNVSLPYSVIVFVLTWTERNEDHVYAFDQSHSDHISQSNRENHDRCRTDSERKGPRLLQNDHMSGWKIVNFADSQDN